MNDQNEACMEQSNDFDEPRYSPLILGRRFPLTATSYKYLDIGIIASLNSHVEISLGDNKGHQITLSHTTWKMFIERRKDIEQFLQLDIGSWRAVCGLHFELIKFEYQKMVKLKHDDDYLIMQIGTLQYLFQIEKCVEQVYNELSDKIHSVSEKYNRFVNIIKIINTKFNCITDKRDAMIEIMHTVSDKSYIDCELLAIAINSILHDALG